MLNPCFVLLSMDDSETERDEQRSAPTKKKCLFDDSIVGKVTVSALSANLGFHKITYSGIFLNTERSYKRQGNAPLKHFVGFPVQWWNNGSINIEVVEKWHFFRQTYGVIYVE